MTHTDVFTIISEMIDDWIRERVKNNVQFICSIMTETAHAQAKVAGLKICNSSYQHNQLNMQGTDALFYCYVGVTKKQ